MFMRMYRRVQPFLTGELGVSTQLDFFPFLRLGRGGDGAWLRRLILSGESRCLTILLHEKLLDRNVICGYLVIEP